MVTDAIGDFITRIRNAYYREKKFVDVPVSKIILAIAKVLREEGFIEAFHLEDESGKKILRVDLKYVDKKPVMDHLVRVSKSGVRKYVGYREIPKIINGLGIAILSTPKGVVTGESARKLRVGGEFLCKVW